MWKTLNISEKEVGLDLTRSYGSLVRWCQAIGCYIQHLHIHVARDPSVSLDEVCAYTALTLNVFHQKLCMVCLPVIRCDCITMSCNDHHLYPCAVVPFLQGKRKDNRARLLLEFCAILFATSSQMKQLSISTKHKLGDVYLPQKLILLVSMASSLECLTLVIPERRNFGTLAESIRSLHNLKVQMIALPAVICVWPALADVAEAGGTRILRTQCCRSHGKPACMDIAQVADLAYLGADDLGDIRQDEMLAARSLVKALCRCPLLQALTLDGIYLRCA